MKAGPSNNNTSRTTNWNVACPKMCLIIVFVISASWGVFGCWLSSYSRLGGSVAKANAAKLSMIKLTHNICTAVNTDCLMTAADMSVIHTAITLTVNWNCRNLRIDRYTLRPHTTARTIELKLSSSRIISEAFFDTCVPVIPMAMPMSPRIRAGASFEPSPVTPTIWPSLFIPSTRIYLCYGLLLAITDRLFTIASNVSSSYLVYRTIFLLWWLFFSINLWFTSLSASRNLSPIYFYLRLSCLSNPIFYNFFINSLAYITLPYYILSSMIPTCYAILVAVILLSPVTISTLIPAFLQSSMAYLDYSLVRSSMPKMPSNINPCFSTYYSTYLFLFSFILFNSVKSSITWYATEIVRRPRLAIDYN